jgi:hypothetical protein
MGTVYRNLRNCAIGVIIGTLGLSYFVIYLLMFLIFHFPSSLEAAFLGRAFGFIDKSGAQSLLVDRGDVSQKHKCQGDLSVGRLD